MRSLLLLVLGAALLASATALSLPSVADATAYATQPLPEGNLIDELKLDFDNVKQQAMVSNKNTTATQGKAEESSDRSGPTTAQR